MRKTVEQLRQDMQKGGSLLKLTILISIIGRYEKRSKPEREEARNILIEIMRKETLSAARYMAYKALCGERARNEAVRKPVEEFESDPKNTRIISLMEEEIERS